MAGSGGGVLSRSDARHPSAIEVTTSRLHAWDYQTDAVGNITSIVETEDCESVLNLANQTLVGSKTLSACDEISASPNVTIASGAAVVFQAGQQISLGNGFSTALGATFSAVIAEPPPQVSTRTFGYQDFQYFLTSADGPPWGSLAWSYDRIGNRLSEDRNGSHETYSYLSNGSGNTAILTQAGSRTYTTGLAGHVTEIDVAGDPIALSIDDAGRVAGFERPVAAAQTALAYDGRSFLARAEDPSTGGFTAPTYDSAGLLHALHRQLSPAAPEERSSVFYFAGRPVAQLRQEVGGGSSWLFLATDHLGTPVLATDLAGGEIWHGPFEPFGEDFYRGSTESALASGVFLRFPGQWEDEIWGMATLGGEVYYNVHRWYEQGTGRYMRVDPEWAESLMLERPSPVALSQLLYGSSRPLLEIDPFGLLSFTYHKSCNKLSERDRKDLEEAANEAGEKVPLTPQCMAKPRDRVKVKCGECGGNCGRQFGGTICINVKSVQGGKCGSGPKCLASTILHEVVHTCGGDQREAYACEKRFYGDTCRFSVPIQYQPQADCPNPCG